jgi:hypothetical protein
VYTPTLPAPAPIKKKEPEIKTESIPAAPAKEPTVQTVLKQQGSKVLYEKPPAKQEQEDEDSVGEKEKAAIKEIVAANAPPTVDEIEEVLDVSETPPPNLADEFDPALEVAKAESTRSHKVDKKRRLEELVSSKKKYEQEREKKKKELPRPSEDKKEKKHKHKKHKHEKKSKKRERSPESSVLDPEEAEETTLTPPPPAAEPSAPPAATGGRLKKKYVLEDDSDVEKNANGDDDLEAKLIL